MELSTYQKTIKDVFQKSSSNLVIDAAPGSGKTFMLCLLAKLVPISIPTIFLAFNKSIAEELSKKLPFNVKAMTLHSLGMRTLCSVIHSKLIVNADKTFALCVKDKNLELEYYHPYKGDRKKEIAYLFSLCKLYDLYRMNLVEDLNQFKNIAFDYDLPAVNDVDLQNLRKIINKMDSYNHALVDGSMIDFTDMLWLCKDFDKSWFNQYGVVFVDEGQDLNPLQKVLVEKILKPDGRFVVVGDERQCIYTFTGSNLQSFKAFKQKENTVTLPLSVTYRCSHKVVDKANEVFSGLECFEGNREGEVRQGTIDEVQEGDYILCRNNQPLVQAYIELLSKGKKATIYGRDYGEKLCKLLDKIDSEDKVEIFQKLGEMRTSLIEELKAKGVQNVDYHPALGNFDEMYSIISLLLSRMSPTQMRMQIKEMFTDEKREGVILMTCHKAKGLENENIFFLNSNLIPSKYAQSPQMLYAERCLYYVAVTRAKNKLVYINLESNETGYNR